MSEEKKLNDATLDQVTGGGNVTPPTIPSEAELGTWAKAAEKTCAGCIKSPADCPYHRDIHTIYLTFGGDHCTFNSRG